MTTRHATLQAALIALALSLLTTGCGDGKMRDRINALDDATLLEVADSHAPDTKAGRLIREEIARRDLPPSTPTKALTSAPPHKPSPRAEVAQATPQQNKSTVGSSPANSRGEATDSSSATLAGPVNSANCGRITRGMSLDSVKRILGEPSHTVGSAADAGICFWRTTDKKHSINVVFFAGEVVDKEWVKQDDRSGFSCSFGIIENGRMR